MKHAEEIKKHLSTYHAYKYAEMLFERATELQKTALEEKKTDFYVTISVENISEIDIKAGEKIFQSRLDELGYDVVFNGSAFFTGFRYLRYYINIKN